MTMSSPWQAHTQLVASQQRAAATGTAAAAGGALPGALSSVVGDTSGWRSECFCSLCGPKPEAEFSTKGRKKGLCRSCMAKPRYTCFFCEKDYSGEKGDPIGITSTALESAIQQDPHFHQTFQV
jgi:hypothetical protein